MPYIWKRLAALTAVAALAIISTADWTSAAPPAPAPAWQSDYNAGKAIMTKLTDTDWSDTTGGSIEQRIGNQPKTAEALLRKALTEAQAAKAGPAAAANITFQLGVALWWQKRHAEAKALFEQAKAMQEKLHPGNSVEVADCIAHIAFCWQALGDAVKCEDQVIDAYEMYLKVLPHDDPRFAEVLPVLGGYTDDDNESVEYYKHFVEVEEKRFGPNSKRVLLPLHLYAASLSNNRQHAEAAKVYARIAALESKTPGEEQMAASTRHHMKGEQDIASGKLQDWQDIECTPRYIGRRTRRKLGLSDADVQLSPREQDRLYGSHDPSEPHREPKLPASPDSSVVPRPIAKQKKEEAPTPKDRRRYFAQGRAISKEEYDALSLSEKACDLIAARKYEEAITILESALRLAPDNANVHCNLAVALGKVARRKESIEHLKQAVALDSEDSAPLGLLGSAYQTNGMLKEAILTYREYVRRFPKESDSVLKQLIHDLEDDLVEQQDLEAEFGPLATQSQQNYVPYVTNHRKILWSQKRVPVKVYIEPGDDTPHFKASFKTILLDCFEEWRIALGDTLTFIFVPSKKQSDIDCYWTNDFSNVSSPAEGGEAQMSHRSGEFNHCTIVLLTEQANSDITPNENDMRALCLHEIGHTLGLVGHSPDPDDIMYNTLPCADRRPHLTQRDVQTLKTIYQRKTASRR